MLKETDKKGGNGMRRKDREITERAEIRSILERAKILRLGLNDETRPYVVPLHYGFSWEGALPCFYIHCAKEGRKLALLRRDPRVFVEIDTGETPVSGGDVPCRYGALYECVMCEARAVILPEGEEKAEALAVLMKTQTGRDFAIDERAAAAVCVVALRAETLSAKARRE